MQRVGDARDAVHQVVKAGKDEGLPRGARRATGVRHRDGAMDVPAREVSAIGPATQAISVKACISMFRQMMLASGAGMHRTLGGRDGLAVACACLSVDEKSAAGRVRAWPICQVRARVRYLPECRCVPHRGRAAAMRNDGAGIRVPVAFIHEGLIHGKRDA